MQTDANIEMNIAINKKKNIINIYPCNIFYNYHIQLFHMFIKWLSPEIIIRLILNKVYSNKPYYILKRNLKLIDCNSFSKKESFSMQKLKKDDFQQILNNISRFDSNTRKELLIRFMFFNNGFNNCYIVKAKNGEPVFLQWLIFPDENPIIKKKLKGRFNPLKEHEVIIENAFTFPKWRGFGILPDMSIKLLNIAKNSGAKICTAYIRQDNISSLNTFMGLGFKIVNSIKLYSILGMMVRKNDSLSCK